MLEFVNNMYQLECDNFLANWHSSIYSIITNGIQFLTADNMTPCECLQFLTADNVTPCEYLQFLTADNVTPCEYLQLECDNFLANWHSSIYSIITNGIVLVLTGRNSIV
jgi:hypothetical protein